MNLVSFPRGTVVAQRFVLEQAAGQGGMGTVYRSRDLQTGEQVAVKMMHAQSTSEALARRFAREAQVLSELRHPSIVSYLTHGHTHDGWPFIAMEWLEGENLAQRLRKSSLTPHESLNILRDITSALSLAHRRGIVHRAPFAPSPSYVPDFPPRAAPRERRWKFRPRQRGAAPAGGAHSLLRR